MATATGWGALPISLSFGDSIKNLVAELNGPVAKAAKNAGGSIEKEIGNAAKNAADRYEKQQWRMEKATKEKTAAEENHRLKLLEQQRAQTALENAEKDLADARETGGKKARDAQLRYEAAQIKVEKATIATRKASDQLDGAIDEVAKATESAERAFNDMEKAQDDAGDSAKSFRDLVREMGDELDETGEKAAGFGDKVMSGLGTIGKGALLGVGAKIGTTVMSGVGTAFSKGFGRLQSLEDAEASLEGLGRSSQDIENIMDSVSQSVTGTAFGLDEAAKSAATFSTLGVKSGEEMDRVMSLLADTTAQSGGELSEISPILSKIVAAGGLNIETYDQLNERATGVGEALSKHLGIPIEEVRDNLADVDFDTFATAMESNIGGAAKKSGETFGNAFGNMQAALGRLGEKFLAPAFEMGPAVFGAIGGAFDKMGEELEPVIEQVTDYLAPIMEEFAQKLGPWLVDTIEDVSQGIKDVVGWIRENADWLKALAVGIGIAVGAWKLFTGAMKLHGIAITIADKGWKAYIASTKIATAVTKLFNKATKANVIGLIATALIAVGGALVYFFTQTETGRELWEKFTNFLSDAWQKVSEKFAEGIDWISEKWDSFTSFMSELWETIKTSVFDAWKDTVQGVRDAWDEFTGAISGAWTSLKDTLVNVWTTVRDAVFVAFMWYVNRVKANFELVTGAINTAWTWLKDGLVAAWSHIRDRVVNAFVNAWNNLRAGFDVVIGALNTAWTWLKDQLYNTWSWIDDNVLGGFRRGMEGFKSFFEGIVDGIKSVWDTLRSALAKPINFMINTVYNGGILKAWETIRKFLPGLKEATPLAGIPEHATGGRIIGPGTGTSDDVLMWGSNGEHMLTAKEVQRLGGHQHVYAMRKMVESGRPFSYDGHGGIVGLPRNVDNRAGDLAGAAPDLLIPGFAKGGEIRPLWEHQLMAAHKFAQSQSGKPYQWAGPTGPGSSFDCSGFMGSIAATIQGTNPWQRYWATGSFPSPGAQGFAPGLGPGFSIGIFNGGPYGGHTAGTLGPAGPYGSVNVESGGAPSMVKYGPGAVGADHSQFTMRYHLPIGADGAFVSGGAGGMSPEAMQDGLKKKVSDFVDKAMNPVLSKLPVGPPEWQNIPKGVYDKGKEGMLDTAFDLVGKLGDKLASVWTAAGEVKDLISGAVSDAASWVNDRVRSIVVRDNGGIVPNGAAAVNLSGKDELMLPPSTTAAFNKFLSQMPGTAGALERAAVAFQAAAEEMGLAEQSRKSAEDYAAAQAGGFLSTWGLEGLVPLAQKAGGMAWDAYAANPVDVAMTPNGVTAYARRQGVGATVNAGTQTVVVEYTGDENDREWKLLNRLQTDVDWLKAKRSPKAGARTRGGVM